MTVEELKRELEHCSDSWHVYIEGHARSHSTVLTDVMVDKQQDRTVVILTDFGHNEKTSASAM